MTRFGVFRVLFYHSAGANRSQGGTITGAEASFARRHRDNTGMMEAFASFFLHEARFTGPA